MNNHTEKLAGVFLPVTTPFDVNMNVDEAALISNMQYYAKSEVNGYLALGSNGENRCLREEEKRRVLEIIIEHKADHQVVMTGCIYDSTVQTIEFMQTAKDLGSDYATLLSPSYFRKQMTHNVLVNYFTECAESVDIPCLLYNAPGFTGVTLSVETVETLSHHPNIVGIKDSASEGIENFCPMASTEFTVMAGSANFFYPSIKMGVKGGIVSLANVVPEVGLTLYRNGLYGQDLYADQYHEKMKHTNRRISGVYGVAGVKAAMDLVGLSGGYPRRPLQRLDGDDRVAVKLALQEAELLK